jgi:hypothetical protein
VVDAVRGLDVRRAIVKELKMAESLGLASPFEVEADLAVEAAEHLASGHVVVRCDTTQDVGSSVSKGLQDVINGRIPADQDSGFVDSESSRQLLSGGHQGIWVR